jgi:hypothetical protein
MVQQASGISIPDAVSGFRAYSREAALRLFVTGQFSYCTNADSVWQTRAGCCQRADHRASHPAPISPPSGHAALYQPAGVDPTAHLCCLRACRDVWGAGCAVLADRHHLTDTVAAAFCRTGLATAGQCSVPIVGSISLAIGLLLLITGVIADRVRETRWLLEEILYRVRRQAASILHDVLNASSTLPLHLV